ncbi:MAG: hypothetical protein ACR2ME_04900 [Acidimicrobiia bacterium]
MAGFSITISTLSLFAAVELARELASQGGYCTVSDGGRLIFAVNHEGQQVGPDGEPSDLAAWS